MEHYSHEAPRLFMRSPSLTVVAEVRISHPKMSVLAFDQQVEGHAGCGRHRSP
jgi:hypothetical protein